MELDLAAGASMGAGIHAGLFARVWRIAGGTALDPATVDALVESVVPQIARLPGYRGGYLLAECEGAAFLRVSFWDSLEHLHAADVMTSNAIAGVMVVTSGTTMTLDVCDVLMSDPPPRLRCTDRAEDA
jgi:hypothetical protein